MELYNCYDENSRRSGGPTFFERESKQHNVSPENLYGFITEQCLIAGKYGGKLFGSSVRSLIVPAELLGIPIKNLNPFNLDFWFTDDESANNFVKESGLRFNRRRKDDFNPYTMKPYLDLPMNYDLCFNFYYLMSVNIYVSLSYPVCDFSVNLLSYDGAGIMVHKPYDVLLLANSAEKINPKETLLPSIDYSPNFFEILSQIKNKKFYISTSFKTFSQQQPQNMCDDYVATRKWYEHVLAASMMVNNFYANVCDEQRKWQSTDNDVSRSDDSQILSNIDNLDNSSKIKLIKYLANSL